MRLSAWSEPCLRALHALCGILFEVMCSVPKLPLPNRPRLFRPSLSGPLACLLALGFLGAAPAVSDAAQGPAVQGPATQEAARSPADQSPAARRERTEVWTGSVLSATFRAGMCTRPDGSLRGVFLLTHSNGQTDVYHLYGHAEGNEFEARHASGHVLTGTYVDIETVKGRMRLKNGMKFKYKGHRHLNAPVTDDCAPLP